MATHKVERIYVFPQQLSGAASAILMIDPVESVSPNALLDPLMWTGINRSGLWHLAMKSGIENRNLRNRAENTSDNLHTLEFGLNMQGRERGDAGDRRAHLGRDDNGILEMGAAVDYAMPDRVDLVNRTDGTRLSIPSGAQQMSDNLLP